MSRSWLLYLDDLIESAGKIGRFVDGRTMSTFSADEALFDAVLFNLQVIGEAIKKLPEEARQTLPGASGSAPARLRDLIAHHYFAIDPEKSSGRLRPSMCRRCSKARENFESVSTAIRKHDAWASAS